ncbi:hypothetical protein VE04_08428 [Pseudogymnoascus sp. 24MN13]|nr:hypothetical protein VE04_08428 [Pseudogymnoascus sp. 24MN13]
MLAQSIRASRSSFARLARSQFISKRTLITPTAVRQADLVQEMYLKELKAYKPAAVKASDAEGHLKAYEDSTVEIEGQAEAGSEAAVEQDWFEEPEEESAKH